MGPTRQAPAVRRVTTAQIEERRLAYERYAAIFSTVHAETHSIAIALEVLDASRAREAIICPPDRYLPTRIIAIAASLFCVPPQSVMQRRRHRDITSARYVAAWLLRRHHWSTTKIGAFLHLDHSTIVHGLQKVSRDQSLYAAAQSAEKLLDVTV
jgi:chromosomal replication initiation ATPase DnaA